MIGVRFKPQVKPCEDPKCTYINVKAYDKHYHMTDGNVLLERSTPFESKPDKPELKLLPSSTHDRQSSNK